MNNQNFIKLKLNAGIPVIGMWSIINSPTNAEIAAVAGLDFQIFDLEHGVYDLPSLESCVRNSESVGCSPLIRVPTLESSVIQNCLDIGAHAILIPQIRNYDEAIKAVKTTKFAPEGSRGFNPFTRAAHYNPTTARELTKINNDFCMTSILIENKEAYQDFDKILTTPQLDIVYLGIYDMSLALGYNGNVRHPDIEAFVISSIKKIKQAKKFSAIMVQNEDDLQKYLDLGVNLITCGVDTHIYHTAIQNKSKKFKELIHPLTKKG